MINNATLWTTEKLLKIILGKQLSEGGFSLDGTGDSDPDLTAMALQALAPYNTDSHPEVQTVVNKALACLAALQAWSEKMLNRTAAKAPLTYKYKQ